MLSRLRVGVFFLGWCWFHLFLEQVNSFVTFQSPHPTLQVLLHSSPLSANDSEESVQQRLVRYGLTWKQTPVEGSSRVPGCVATVYVRASISERERVQIVGNADAIVSRGLLAVLAEFLEQNTVDGVLALDPTKISQMLHLQSVLSPGRNDGLANMIRVIQAQLKGKEHDEMLAGNANANSFSNRPTVALLLSGGVDSSVALRLLQQDGYDVTAFYLKIWLEDELAHLGECPWEEDVAICQKVCDQAGVPL